LSGNKPHNSDSDKPLGGHFLDGDDHFRRILELVSTTIVVIVFDYDGNILYANDNASLYLGAETEQITGANYRDFFTGDSTEINLQLIRGVIDNSEIVSEETNVVINGKYFWFDAQAQPFKNDKGEVIGALVVATDITNRKNTEEALKASEERFREIFENATIGLYRTSPDGKLLMANPAIIRMLGYNSYDELSDRNVENGYVFPEYRNKFIELIKTEGRVSGWQSAWKRRDGTILYVRESARAVHDKDGKIKYYEGTVEDISSSHQVEKELRESEHRYRQLVEQLPDAVLIITSGKISFCNPSGAKLLGADNPDQITSTRLDKFIHPDSRREIKKLLSPASKKTEDNILEYKIITQEKQVRYIEATAVSFTQESRKTIQLVASDVTERRKAKEDLEKAHRRLKREQEQLKEKNAALKEILTHIEEEKMELKGQIAHDLERTILPALRKLIRPDGSPDTVLLDMVKNSLEELATGTGGMRYLYSRLSLRETQICNLLKSGATSKEVAESLNISVETIHKHRSAIRRKLGLTNKSVNLAAFLNRL